jgi:hypothetical protein
MEGQDMADEKRTLLEKLLQETDGIIPLEPAWVCRSFLPAGHRLGLENYMMDDPERGEVCERWLASTTKADNAIGPEDEGFSYIKAEAPAGERLLLRDVVAAAPELIVGEEYAAAHKEMLKKGSLGRLAKMYDFAVRLPYHIHQMQKDASKLGRTSKEEAYYFPPGVSMLGDDSTFFGMRPELMRAGVHKQLLAQYLTEWQEGKIETYDQDWILNYSIEEKLQHEVGFLLPAGGLHAPGSAVTIELQEDSDVFAMLQAVLSDGTRVPKEALWKDVHADDKAKLGVNAVVEQVDWDLTANAEYAEDYKLVPVLRQKSDGGKEEWIYYGGENPKFTGTKVTVEPGKAFTCQDAGAYNVFIWDGEGDFGGQPIKGTAGRVGDHKHDELFVTFSRATRPLEIKNTGDEPLLLVKFFGPDINKEGLPLIKAFKK